MVPVCLCVTSFVCPTCAWGNNWSNRVEAASTDDRRVILSDFRFPPVPPPLLSRCLISAIISPQILLPQRYSLFPSNRNTSVFLSCSSFQSIYHIFTAAATEHCFESMISMSPGKRRVILISTLYWFFSLSTFELHLSMSMVELTSGALYPVLHIPSSSSSSGWNRFYSSPTFFST